VFDTCFKLGSNQRPQGFQPCALPTELLKHGVVVAFFLIMDDIPVKLLLFLITLGDLQLNFLKVGVTKVKKGKKGKNTRL
jgi:hypothetical protein